MSNLNELRPIQSLSPFKRFCPTIGNLPSSYLVSLSCEEQLYEIEEQLYEIVDFINVILEQKISNYIEQKFNDIMINSMYDEETETLILYLDH